MKKWLKKGIGNSFFWCVAVLFCVFFSGCGSKDQGEKNERPKIVATSTMVADMVRAVAGDDFEVTGLIAPGVDPHTYEPPARVYGELRNADAVIYNGFHLEGKMTEAFESLGERAMALTDHLPKDRLLSPEAIDDQYGDPHIWGDASLWALAVAPVVDKLSSMRPEKKNELEERGKAYRTEIEALHEWISDRINEIPKERRVLITSHDAFNYFGRAYGVEVYGVQGISTVDEPGLADITNTIDLIKKRGVGAIFTENSVSPAVIKRISKDAGVKVGRELFSDSCGRSGETESMYGETYDVGTYVGMMKHNLNAILDALK